MCNSYIILLASPKIGNTIILSMVGILFCFNDIHNDRITPDHFFIKNSYYKHYTCNVKEGLT